MEIIKNAPQTKIRKSPLPKVVIAPKAHLHSSAKDGPMVPWFSGVRIPTDSWAWSERQTDRVHPTTEAEERAQLCPDPPNGCGGHWGRGPACRSAQTTDK